MRPPIEAATTAGHGRQRAAAAEEKPRLVDVFRQHHAAYRGQFSVTPEQSRLLGDMVRCRTAALGGRLYQCDHCGVEVPLYNSCGNRACPQCQALDQARWIAARQARVLPIGHHHVVFTLPSELRPLALRHPRAMYGLLLKTVGQVLTSLAEEHLKVHLGATLVLHTWTRELSFHPHVHCVVTAGGLRQDGEGWEHRRDFLLSIHLLKAAFRARILCGLDRLRQGGLQWDDDPEAWNRLFAKLPKAAKWVVYTEPPFGRSTHVLQYLGRYTHRVGLSDQRLVAVTADAVTFRTRGSATLTLKPLELMRRYLRHVLPAGLNKIRHVGLYAAVHMRGELAQARALLGEGDLASANDEPPDVTAPAPASPAAAELDWTELLAQLLGATANCPHCRQGRLLQQAVLPRVRAPPEGAS